MFRNKDLRADARGRHLRLEADGAYLVPVEELDPLRVGSVNKGRGARKARLASLPTWLKTCDHRWSRDACHAGGELCRHLPKTSAVKFCVASRFEKPCDPVRNQNPAVSRRSFGMDKLAPPPK